MAQLSNMFHPPLYRQNEFPKGKRKNAFVSIAKHGVRKIFARAGEQQPQNGYLSAASSDDWNFCYTIQGCSKVFFHY